MPDHYQKLLTRHESNPILTAQDWPYPVHTVFNPAAVRLSNGETLLLCRVEDRSGLSHFCTARSMNGVDGWQIDSAPTFCPDPVNYPEEAWGVEDPRVTYVPEEEEYLIAYTAFGRSGPGVAIASTVDFVHFQRYGMVMHPSDKNAALFPRRIRGEFAMIHRPTTEMTSHMWLSFSPNLHSWGGQMLLLPARRGSWWDANKIGLTCPPIETEEGWLILYHGVRVHASGSIYRIGLALLDLENPEVCLRRGREWIFGPEAPYELVGDVGSVVFPCGYTLQDDGDTIRIYYGAADTCIAMATGSVRQMLDWLRRDGEKGSEVVTIF